MLSDDELRALADALSVPHHDLATVDVIRAADYLRACADAEPTGYFGKSVVDGVWIEMEPWATNAIPLYAHPAPVAPQEK